MKSVKIFKAVVSAGLFTAVLFGIVTAAGAEESNIIARCSLVEKSIVKTVHYELKVRELQWQVSKKAVKYPWVQSILANNPAAALIPEAELAEAHNSQNAKPAVLATMQFIKTDDRPFAGGKVALGDIALAVYPSGDTPIRYAMVKKNGKVMITRRQTPKQPTVHLTYNMGQ